MPCADSHIFTAAERVQASIACSPSHRHVGFYLTSSHLPLSILTLYSPLPSLIKLPLSFGAILSPILLPCTYRCTATQRHLSHAPWPCVSPVLHCILEHVFALSLFESSSRTQGCPHYLVKPSRLALRNGVIMSSHTACPLFRFPTVPFPPKSFHACRAYFPCLMTTSGAS